MLKYHMDREILKPWVNNPLFRGYDRDKRILHCVCEFLEHALYLDGDVAEFGVWKGKMACLMAHVMRRDINKKLYLLDTFSGMPPVSSEDNHWKEGDFLDTSVEEVHENMVGCGNYEVLEGLFEETVHAIQDKRFCFVHLDADIYTSTKFATEFVYPRTVAGGVLIYDDYGDKISRGCKMAVDEFFENKPEKVIYLPTKQAVVIKHSS